MRAPLVRAAALALVLLGTACGVPREEEPRPLDRAEAPFRVFEPSAPTSEQGDVEVQLWFVRGDRLIPVTRRIEPPASASRVLGAVFDGVIEQERAGGLSSAIPTSVELVGVDLRDGVAVVTLDGLTEQVQVQVQAYGQMVATLDALPGVSGVRFRAGSRDLPVPRGDTSLTDEPVDTDEYAELIGPPPGTAAPMEPAPAPPPGG